MRISILVLLGWTATLAGACGGSTPDGAGSITPPPPTTSTVATVSVTPLERVLVPLGYYPVSAQASAASGAVLPDAVFQWATSDPSIAVVEVSENDNPVNKRAVVRAMASGKATIRATSAGKLGSTVVSVLEIGTGASPVVIDDFRVLEYQYPSSPGKYHYAPQVRLRDTTGRASLLVALSIAIPGFARTIRCGAQRTLSVSPIDLFQYFDIDYQFTLEQSGARANVDEPAVAHIIVRVSEAAATELIVSGPIVPGPYPGVKGDPLEPLYCLTLAA